MCSYPLDQSILAYLNLTEPSFKKVTFFILNYFSSWTSVAILLKIILIYFIISWAITKELLEIPPFFSTYVQHLGKF